MLKLYIEKNITSKELLKQVFKDFNIEEEIIYNEYGKPYIKSNKIYFNISHSKEYIVCAVSDKCIGIDIEYITYRPRVANRYFNAEEKKLAINDIEFTKIWVKKESYLKWLGSGLSYGLLNVDTTKIDNYELIKKDNYFICIYERAN